MKGKLYRRKRSIAKRVYRKGKSPFNSYSRTKQLIKLINKVSLKKAETKQGHFNEENVNMNHNSGILRTNILYTTQGTTDTETGASNFANRIGDEVIARGIKFKFWIANKYDRPNILYRLVIFKYQSLKTPVSSDLWKGANGNKIMDDFDREAFTPLYQRIFKIQMGVSGVLKYNETLTTNYDAYKKEAFKYLSVYVPLKNMKIKYSDGGNIPKFTNVGMVLIPYDAYGTLTTDTVASVNWSYKFYFKDP